MKKGSKHTAESIKKIIANNTRTGKKFIFSVAHRQNLSKANQGQISWIKGKHQSLEHIQNRVQSRIKNGNYSHQPSGENHYLWVKDRTQLAKTQERNDSAYREWRKEVKNRDGWKCRISNQDCSGKLVAHHILGWTAHPELRYEVKNGITLCHFHHPRKRNDEMILSPYFQNLVIEKAK